MVAGIGSTLPIFYLCSPAWTNRFMLSPLLIYFGEPVGIFAVPLASFIFDLATRPCTRLRSVWPFHLIRSIIEIAFILTYWAIAWEYAMLEFGWLWI